jgi:hypothetical protein
MCNYIQKTIDGLNKYINILKSNSNTQELFVSVILFTTKSEYICRAMSIKKVFFFEQKHFKNSGSTAIYDVVGDVIIEWMNHPLDTNKLYIISDGGDMNSTKYTKQDIDQLIEIMISKSNWQIINCDTDTSVMKNINKIIYNVEDIDSLFNKMSI